MAAILAAAIVFSAVPVFALDTTVTSDPIEIGEETTTEEITETTTEINTEETTQAVTEKPTEAKTEKPTEAKTETTTQAVMEKPTEATTKTPAAQKPAGDTDPIKEGHPHEVNIHINATTDGKYGTNDSDYIYASDYIDIDPRDLDWSSDNEKVAAVDSRGRISTLRAGHAVVTGSGTVKYMFHITVKEIATEDKDITLYEDEKIDLSKYVKKGNIDYYDWSSDDRSIVTVDDEGNARSKDKDGHAVITADNEKEHEIYKFYIRVRKTANNHPVDHNFIEEDMPLYMSGGDSADVSIFLDKAADSYKWYSDNTSVARVDGDNGVITARNEGTTTVHAHGTLYDYCFKVMVDDNYSIDSREMNIEEVFDYGKYIDGKINDAEAYSFKGHILDVYNGKIEARTKGAGYVIFKSAHDEVHQLLVNVKEDHTRHSTETATEAVTEKTTVDINFTDISHRPWAGPAIKNMAASGFISGRGNGIFAPDDGCTKADFTIVLVRMLGLDSMAPSGNYADVLPNAYYYNYVSIARNNGLTVGVDGDSFHPAQNITREEIMAMVYNGLALKGVDMNIKQSVLSSYSDGSLISPQYRDAVSALLNMGAVQGTSATTIDPKSSVTRAQMAVLLNNIYTTVLK